MRFVDETILFSFIDDVGLKSADLIFEYIISKSPIIKFLIIISASVALIDLALSLKNKHIPIKAITFSILLILGFRQGSGNSLFLSLTRGVTNLTETSLSIIWGSIFKEDGTSIPPGALQELIMSVSLHGTPSPVLNDSMLDFTKECMDVSYVEAENGSIEKASLKDVFKFRQPCSSEQDCLESPIISSYLKDKCIEGSLYSFGSGRKSCDGFYTATDKSKYYTCYDIFSYFKTVLNILSNHQFGSITNLVYERDNFANNKGDSNNQRMKNWLSRNDKYKKLALNLHTSFLLSYSQSHAIMNSSQDYNRENWADLHIDRMMLELRGALAQVSTSATSLFSLGAQVTDPLTHTAESMSALNMLGIRLKYGQMKHSVNFGALLEDLGEKYELAPYQLSIARLVLYLLFPFAFILGFMYQLKYLFGWFAAYISLHIIPMFLSLLRAVHTSFMIAKLDLQEQNLGCSAIEKAWNVVSNDLSCYINPDNMTQFLTDFIPLAYSQIQIEIAALNFMLAGSVFLAWAVGNIGHRSYGKSLNFLSGLLMGTLQRSTISSPNNTSVAIRPSNSYKNTTKVMHSSHSSQSSSNLVYDQKNKTKPLSEKQSDYTATTEDERFSATFKRD